MIISRTVKTLSSEEKRGATLRFKAPLFFALMLLSFIFSLQAYAEQQLDIHFQASGGHTDLYIDNCTMGETSYKGWVDDIDYTGSTYSDGLPCASPPFVSNLETFYAPYASTTFIGRWDFYHTTGFGGGIDYTFSFLHTEAGTWTEISSSTVTRIISVTPYDGQTVATTTTVGITGYINALDLDSTSEVKIYMNNRNCSGTSLNAIDAIIGTCDKTLTFTPTQAGFFSTSSVVDFHPWAGQWSYRGTIETSSYCLFGFCFKTNTQAATSTTFTVGQPSLLDQVIASSTPIIEALTDGDLASCAPLSGYFDIARCLAVMFVPDSEHIQIAASNFKDNVFSRWPVGYAVRFFDIVANAPTTTLPLYTFDIHFSSTSSSTIAFDLNDMLAGGGTLMDTPDPYHGKTFEDVLYPIVQTTVFFLVAIIIVRDVMGSHRHANNVPKNAT